jgi:hypothetical protein
MNLKGNIMSLITHLQRQFSSLVINPVTGVNCNQPHNTRGWRLKTVYSIMLNVNEIHRVHMHVKYIPTHSNNGQLSLVIQIILSFRCAKLMIGIDNAGNSVKKIQVNASDFNELFNMLTLEIIGGTFDNQFASISSRRGAA